MNKVVAVVIFLALATGLFKYTLTARDFNVEEHIPDLDKDIKKAAQDAKDAKNEVTQEPVVDFSERTHSLLEPFINDPSYPVRCKEQPIPTSPSCPKWPLPTTDQPVPELMMPKSPGATTKGMVLKKMSEVVGSPVQQHPIFSHYAKRTYSPEWIENRVVEFNGAHTDYTYDCEENVDFRLYHQCRTAMCLEYETRKTLMKDGGQSGPDDVKHGVISTENGERQLGMFPLNDEEYFEMVMTLTTAMQASEEGLGYTFIELGARYGTWIVRAGASFRMMNNGQKKDDVPLRLLAVEGNCPWFQKMREHVECNGFGTEADLILGYAAPRSYNKVVIGQPGTYKEPRAVSLLDMLPSYEFVDMIDFDIQGFEWLTIQERGAFDLMTQKVGFVHFGTHSTEIERNIVTHAQDHGWCVVYFFAGAHTKKLDRGHRCNTPYGPSGFNDGVLGIANLKWYPQLEGKCPKVSVPSLKKTAKVCHHIPQALDILRRKPRS